MMKPYGYIIIIGVLLLLLGFLAGRTTVPKPETPEIVPIDMGQVTRKYDSLDMRITEMNKVLSDLIIATRKYKQRVTIIQDIKPIYDEDSLVNSLNSILHGK